MTHRQLHVLVLMVAAGWVSPALSQPTQRPYRLNSVDLKQRVVWGAECRLPDGRGLAFGGQDQDADDGRPHTRLLDNGEWTRIDADLQARNPLQKCHVQAWELRNAAKSILARARFIYFQGLEPEAEKESITRGVAPALDDLMKKLDGLHSGLRIKDGDVYTQTQSRIASRHLEVGKLLLPSFSDGITPGQLQQIHSAQIHFAQAAEALDAEPPARAIHCGTARRQDDNEKPANGIVFDQETGLYVIFGGDHLDYLTNDTWVFDPAKLRWFQRHPSSAPPPRANHRLEATGDGIVRMSGGYTYSSNTDYVGGQYVDLADGEWVYDVEQDTWRGGKLVPLDTRVYRTGPFHPDFYFQGEKPNAADFKAWLAELPTNEWVPTNPPQLPRLNRDWGTARIDPDRDMILRWSGGHSAHGGTDVLHYHFSTNRWELPFPVEFPLGQLYSNTSYPNGFNFNRRPWMTGHTYQNYAYDPPSRKMVKAGRPRHFYVYDPDVGDWIGRGRKPQAMQYNSSFYTLTLTATPHGAVCWGANGRVHRFKHAGNEWVEVELSGEKLPGAYVDNSTIAYDSKRDRVLIVNTLGYQKPFDGQVWSVDPRSGKVSALSPAGREHAHRFSNVDKCCYDAVNDLLLMGTFLKDSGEHTPTPAYDCQSNRWVTLDLKYSATERGGRTRRAFPHSRSDGRMFEPRRRLIRGTDTNSQVYVLRMDTENADMRPLK